MWRDVLMKISSGLTGSREENCKDLSFHIAPSSSLLPSRQKCVVVNGIKQQLQWPYLLVKANFVVELITALLVFQI